MPPVLPPGYAPVYCIAALALYAMAHVILVLRNRVQYAHARILAVTSCIIDAVIVHMQPAQCTCCFFNLTAPRV
jgi:hypothetical protein